jgi:hypothetical protein
MFNGPNSQGSANTPKNYQTQPTEDWSLNPAFYQNIAGNELVDWAAIAAKWIQMKESYPQNISTQATMANSGPAKELLDEKGEAPMEVEKEEDIPSAEPVTVVSTDNKKTRKVVISIMFSLLHRILLLLASHSRFGQLIGMHRRQLHGVIQPGIIIGLRNLQLR